MREIKFRGWHIPSKTWMSHEDCLSAIMLQGRVNNKTADDEGFLGRCIIEQFTGLHDSKGVEIFEGDVIKISLGRHWWIWKVSVLDNNKSNTLYLVGIKDNLTKSEDGEVYTYKEQPLVGRDEIEFKQPKNMEVIGNIHEQGE